MRVTAGRMAGASRTCRLVVSPMRSSTGGARVPAMRRPLALVAALCAIAPAAALAADRVQDVDFERDGAPEQLVVRELECYGEHGSTPPPCPEDGFASRQATVIGACTDGRVQNLDLLGRPHDAFVAADVAEADGRPSTTEVFVVGRSGAAARVGDERVVRIVRGADGCLKRKILFKHPGKGFETRRPKRASYAGTGNSTLDGKGHLRLEQPWYKRTDGGCCPTYLAIATFAYDARAGKFVKTRERYKRIPRG